MKMYLSGGSEIAETGLKDPYIMLSWYVVVNKRGVPNSRCRRVMRNIRKRKRREQLDRILPKRLRIRFWSRVDKKGPDDCWEWMAGKIKGGYGEFHTWKHRGELLAHRLALELRLGRILQKGEWSLHSCDNPGCCNPNHLFVGDAPTNSADMASKGRSPRGENHCHAKLTEDQVKKIIKWYRIGKHNQPTLARMFKVSPAKISNIVLGKDWKHIPR